MLKRALLIGLDGFLTLMELPSPTRLIHLEGPVFAKIHEARDLVIFEEQPT
jgi:hypothetical protein